MLNVGSSCCWCSTGTAWALARKSHSIRGRKWCQQQQAVCRQGREWACLMCYFFFASPLHLPLPPPHPKPCPIKLCIPAVEIVGFHLISFDRWGSWDFLVNDRNGIFRLKSLFKRRCFHELQKEHWDKNSGGWTKLTFSLLSCFSLLCCCSALWGAFLTFVCVGCWFY